MTKVLKTGVRINKLAPIRSGSGSFGWDNGSIAFGDPTQNPGKRQEQKKAAQERWKERKAEREHKARHTAGYAEAFRAGMILFRPRLAGKTTCGG